MLPSALSIPTSCPLRPPFLWSLLPGSPLQRVALVEPTSLELCISCSCAQASLMPWKVSPVKCIWHSDLCCQLRKAAPQGGILGDLGCGVGGGNFPHPSLCKQFQIIFHKTSKRKPNESEPQLSTVVTCSNCKNELSLILCLCCFPSLHSFSLTSLPLNKFPGDKLLSQPTAFL